MDPKMSKIGFPLMHGKDKEHRPTCHIWGVEVMQNSNVEQIKEVLEYTNSRPDYPDKQESIDILNDILEGWRKWAYIN